MKIGIDVGGTHTDAVVVDGNNIIAAVKSLTTEDISSGITHALESVLNEEGVESSNIQAVMIGTTQFTNAVVERRHMNPVAAIRIGRQSSAAVPPKVGWPVDIDACLGSEVFMLEGGYEYHGGPICPLDDREVDALIKSLRARQIGAVALCGVYAPVNAEQENAVADRIKAELPEVDITLSHQVGRIGLLQRENAALLNASLMGLSKKVIRAFQSALKSQAIQAPLFISQNDGTVMTASYAEHFPVLTFSSGPTNSMRGAAFLSGLRDAIVIDVGGTTADVGMLVHGYPRESNVAIEVGGVSTNFRMPDILPLALGGGSIVQEDGKTIGPISVGHDLVSRGRIFGGDTLTATDIAVAAGVAEIGEPARVSALSEQTVQTAMARMREMLADTVDRIKTGDQPLSVIAVGGGAFLVPEDLPGAESVLRPGNAGVANAVGAALAEIGGEVEMLYVPGKTSRGDAIAEATRLATVKAVEAGACSDTTRVTDIEETTLAYMAEDTERLRVKVVGQLKAA
ncbi:hydantoinase/oxoprolinase family protein [Pseudomaricurvus alkylphenolicus]|uniref:hydantoinase/oxoprolinase N-terminal domain-containing protein n=1 Tax=Pseudomaricurvus alkylphenolicus TaxID=1306991 RepID=UPI001421A9F3|nr:hydantoinase/oxoprolinase family protein [Pseudomaricurvus alkylphenolicus]NIB40929.1 hydantoinase/oxoprolinase family protein [Pseudomaricurvus alkylphenolicus]